MQSQRVKTSIETDGLKLGIIGFGDSRSIELVGRSPPDLCILAEGRLSSLYQDLCPSDSAVHRQRKENKPGGGGGGAELQRKSEVGSLIIADFSFRRSNPHALSLSLQCTCTCK